MTSLTIPTLILSGLLALSLASCNASAQATPAGARPHPLRAATSTTTALATTRSGAATRTGVASAARVSAASPTFYENRLRGFVYHWFSLFDSNAPHEEFLKRMVQDQSLEFRFPEATLRSERDFRGWYDGILKNIRVASHSVRSIRIEPLAGNEFKVLVDVVWRGLPFQGEPVLFHASQEWQVLVSGPDFNDIRIRKYLVSAAGTP